MSIEEPKSPIRITWMFLEAMALCLILFLIIYAGIFVVIGVTPNGDVYFENVLTLYFNIMPTVILILCIAGLAFLLVAGKSKRREYISAHAGFWMYFTYILLILLIPLMPLFAVGSPAVIAAINEVLDGFQANEAGLGLQLRYWLWVLGYSASVWLPPIAIGYIWYQLKNAMNFEIARAYEAQFIQNDEYRKQYIAKNRSQLLAREDEIICTNHRKTNSSSLDMFTHFSRNNIFIFFSRDKGIRDLLLNYYNEPLLLLRLAKGGQVPTTPAGEGLSRDKTNGLATSRPQEKPDLSSQTLERADSTHSSLGENNANIAKNFSEEFPMAQPNDSFSTDIELVRFEHKIGELVNLLQSATAPQSAWAHYKSTKHTRRSYENLLEINKVLDAFVLAAETASRALQSHNNLIKTMADKKRFEIEMARLPELEHLKHDLNAVTFKASIAEKQEKIAKHEAEICKSKNPPPPGKSKAEIEAEKQAKREAEAERRGEKIKKKIEMLKKDPNVKEEDIPELIEQFKRDMGWLDHM